MAQHETEPIGQLLLDRGWISTDQLSSALDRQRELGGRLGTALLEMGAVPEDRLVKTLAEQGNLPLGDIDELRRVPQEVIDLLPAKVALRHRAVPFRLGRGRVDLAVRRSRRSRPSTSWPSCSAVGWCSTSPTRPASMRRWSATTGTRCRRASHLLDRLNQPAGPAAQEPPAEQVAPDAAVATAPAEARPQRRRGSEPTRLPRPTSVPLSLDEKKSLRRLASGDSVKPLSQNGIQKALQAASGADDIGAALLGFLGQEFLRLLIFRVGQGRVRGWMGRSPALDEYGFRNWTVGFDEPSVFLNLRQGAEFFLGRLPPMPAHERLLKCWRGSLDTECAVFPVKVRDRLVCAIYGDRDSLGLAGLDVPAVQRLTGKAAIAFEMLLMQRKLRS